MPAERSLFHGGVDLLTVEGPLTSNHGCGVRDWWDTITTQWLVDVLVSDETEDAANREPRHGEGKRGALGGP